MTTLILGATGATGRLVVDQLIQRGEKTKLIVRSSDRLPPHLKVHDLVTITTANVLDLSNEQLMEHVKDCDAVISCLGHNLTLQGMFGHPRRLVTETTEKICFAIEAIKPDKPIKFILMNTTGNQNKSAGEMVSLPHIMVVCLLRTLLPPHADNEQAAAFLQQQVSKKSIYIEWVGVRPDSLINQAAPSAYEIYSSPIRDPIFNAGKTSRANVAHFMISLLTDPILWQCWRGQLPVIYNSDYP
ncbi:NAD(P)-binding oxidoreductase [Vibrio sp. 99-70-13A1]|uniref:NAD(P)-dependent oxidoreductase n=1 Tax=Vibrio sp. 99-70-13A1 TaxID=2607601 RepID=UPI001493B8B5|nr:NAD(P)-binding oxidoreductase [Vibrio sp. 99-70-13A1]NOH98114.1 NAD(P)H-binding protein [Vibrio sp. 99-70-13A1]